MEFRGKATLIYLGVKFGTSFRYRYSVKKKIMTGSRDVMRFPSWPDIVLESTFVPNLLSLCIIVTRDAYFVLFVSVI